MKLIETNIILLFVLLSYLPSPYKSNFVKDFSSNVRIHESILMSSCMRHLRRSVKFWQRRKKLVVDSDPKLQEQSGRWNIAAIVSWKLWLNLYSLRWLKPKRNLVRSLIPRLSETLNKLLGEGLINFSNEFLKTSYDTDLRISGLKLFHSLIVYEKKEFAKYSVLQYIFCSAIHIHIHKTSPKLFHLFLHRYFHFTRCIVIWVTDLSKSFFLLPDLSSHFLNNSFKVSFVLI